jgi:N-acetyl-alpha-D-muramate 1-phosphate uridylyltransferase
MTDSLAGLVLAAGAGTRLRPLTHVRPKPLCPVDNAALVDIAVERVRAATPAVAVNVHHGRALLEAHLGGRVHVSVEEEQALGTAGAVGAIRDWLDGRPVLVVNGDTWHRADLAAFAGEWDGEQVRVLLGGPGGRSLGPGSQICASLLPWKEAAGLLPEPSGLYEVCWRPAQRAGCLEETWYEGPVLPCDTPAAYLAANLAASGGASVIGPGASVEGQVERSVVWSGASVLPGETLVSAIRTPELTVLVR